MFTFNDQIVWVTGSSTGIGRAMAIAFAAHGATVVVHGNQNRAAAEECLAEVKAAGATDSILVMGDLTDPEVVRKIGKEMIDTFGRIDTIINNAGSMVARVNLEEIEAQTWQRTLDVNITSILNVYQSMVPALKKQKSGSIINVTSVAAKNGGGIGAGAYASAKAAVTALTKNMAKEVAGDGIRVNGISPGVIDTPFHDRFTSEQQMAAMIAQIPMGRAGKPEDTAGAALFLASPYAEYITGEIIEVNGGMLMN